VIGKDKFRTLSPHLFEHGLCKGIQDHQSILSSFDLFFGDDEHAGVQFRYVNLPVPGQFADFLVQASGVGGEARHASKIYRQLIEKSLLFTPIQRIWFTAIILSEKLDSRSMGKPRKMMLIYPFAWFFPQFRQVD
jgi:hypothetical protein